MFLLKSHIYRIYKLSLIDVSCWRNGDPLKETFEQQQQRKF